VEVVASLSQGRTAAAQCGLFTHKSVPVIFEPPCIFHETKIELICSLVLILLQVLTVCSALQSETSENLSPVLT